jgi:hypothetical protein
MCPAVVRLTPARWFRASRRARNLRAAFPDKDLPDRGNARAAWDNFGRVAG